MRWLFLLLFLIGCINDYDLDEWLSNAKPPVVIVSIVQMEFAGAEVKLRDGNGNFATFRSISLFTNSPGNILKEHNQ